MDYGESTPIFHFADNLDRAKLLTVFVVHGVALVLLFLMSRFQPESTLGRMQVDRQQGDPLDRAGCSFGGPDRDR
jgi:hypothetical protein